jgi:hypothetical protein
MAPEDAMLPRSTTYDEQPIVSPASPLPRTGVTWGSGVGHLAERIASHAR